MSNYPRVWTLMSWTSVILAPGMSKMVIPIVAYLAESVHKLTESHIIHKTLHKTERTTSESSFILYKKKSTKIKFGHGHTQ